MNARWKSPRDSDINTDFKLTSQEKFLVDLDETEHQLVITNKSHNDALTKCKLLNGGPKMASVNMNK